MKVLSVAQSAKAPPGQRVIWLSEACIVWASLTDTTSVRLVVDSTILLSGDDYLRKCCAGSQVQFDIEPRCVGIVEATDEEMQILVDAGYQLVDLRDMGALGLVYELQLL